MAITTRQADERKRGIGASDAAAILGLNPWRNAGDVLARKLDLVPDEPPGEAAEIGLALESGIADLAAKRLGRKLVSPTSTFWHPAGLPILANPDRFVEKCQRGAPIVEIKHTGQTDGWGEPGTDQIPDYVQVQVQVQLMCVEADEAHVACLANHFGRSSLSLYRVVPNADLQRIIEDRLTAWWTRHVVERAPLAECPPSLDVLAKIRREPDRVCTVPADLVQAWRDAEADVKSAEERRDMAKAAVRAVLAQEQAEAGVCDLGKISDREQARSSIDAERLRAELPDIAVKFTKSTTFRVMRFTAAKVAAMST